MRRPSVDPSISLGNVLSVIVILIGLYGATADLRERIATLETKINPLWEMFTNGQAR